MNKILKVFLIDIGCFAGAVLLFYLLFVAFKAIQNGRKHRLTNDHIFSYCSRLFPSVAERWIRPLIKWLLIAFIIHLVITVFDVFGDYISSVVTYEKIPVLALIFDIFKSTGPLIMPFLIPTLIILLVFILGYGFFGTLHQLSENDIEMDKMTQFAKTVDKKNQLVPVSTTITDKDKKLQKKIAKDAYKPTKKEIFSYFSENVHKAFMGIFKFIPKILLVVVVLIGLNSLIVSVTGVTKVVDNMKHIKELNTAVKNLSDSDSYTRITMLDEVSSGDLPIKKYKIEILSDKGDTISSQEVQLRGKQIALDSINVNFDYSEIAEGAHYNIAYPYRVYSEVIPATSATELTCVYNDEEIPVMYSLENKDIIGMTEDSYYSSLKEIFEIIKDDAASKENGIRSTVGNLAHKEMKKGDIIDINIEGTGAITVKKHNSLYTSESDAINESDS